MNYVQKLQQRFPDNPSQDQSFLTLKTRNLYAFTYNCRNKRVQMEIDSLIKKGKESNLHSELQFQIKYKIHKKNDPLEKV